MGLGLWQCDTSMMDVAKQPVASHHPFWTGLCIIRPAKLKEHSIAALLRGYLKYGFPAPLSVLGTVFQNGGSS